MMVGRLPRLIAALELPLTLAIAPLLLFPTPQRVLALALVPLIWGCAWITTRRLVPATPVNVSLWALLSLTALGLLVTPDILFSLGKVTGLVLGICLFWALVRWIDSPRRTAWAAGAFLVSGGVLSVLGLLGADWRTDKLPIVAPIIELIPTLIRGIPGAVDGFNPNAVAGCLVLFLPVQVSVLLSRERPLGAPWAKALQLFLLLMTAATLVLLQSRGAWLGLALGGVSYLLLHKRTRSLGLLLSVVAGLALLAVITFGPPDLSLARANDTETLASRVEVWSRAIYMVRDHPFTGVGMNHFRIVMPELYPAFSLTTGLDIAHAHNQFLQTALDLGLPGVIAYLAVWIGSVFTLMRALRVARGLDHALLAGVLAGLLAHVGFGMTDAIPLGAKVGVTYWFTLALGLAVACRALGEHPAALTGRRVP